jgi:hypothetical protein
LRALRFSLARLDWRELHDSSPDKTQTAPQIKNWFCSEYPFDCWLEYQELYGLEVTGSINGIVICKQANKVVETKSKQEDNEQ